MMECTKCGEEKNKKNSRPKLTIHGVDYNLRLDTTDCKECAKKYFLTDFSRIERIIKKGEGAIIDWIYYSKLLNDAKVTANKILVILNILDYKSLGNWEIVGKGANLNPKTEGQIFYFKREPDVREFAKINYPWTSYYCEIRRISRVISQEDF